MVFFCQAGDKLLFEKQAPTSLVAKRKDLPRPRFIQVVLFLIRMDGIAKVSRQNRPMRMRFQPFRRPHFRQLIGRDANRTEEHGTRDFESPWLSWMP